MSSNLPGPQSPLGSFADKLTIETPEQTALDFAVAGVGSRFLALRLCLRFIGLPLACRFRLSLALVFLRGLPPCGCLNLCHGARISFRPLPFGLCLGERLVGLPLGLGIGGSFFRCLLLGQA